MECNQNSDWNTSLSNYWKVKKVFFFAEAKVRKKLINVSW
jgi:hypothetical protein